MHNRDIFLIFFNMKVCCMFSLESPHGGIHIIMNTYNIPFLNTKKKITLNYPKSAAMGFFPNGPMNKFETMIQSKPTLKTSTGIIHIPKG